MRYKTDRTRRYRVHLKDGSPCMATVREVNYFGYLQGVRVTVAHELTAAKRRTCPLRPTHVYSVMDSSGDRKAIDTALSELALPKATAIERREV